ncbi:MAG: type II toxin-antitoxin system VapC family toxin [Deltaproteobacteria bacterium]|nr:type II toxin-antitoxin system VapC family toxin [Deltaproteobacteria bacterium]
MKKLKLYLDTSVLNFLFADDAPEFKKVTREFFEMVNAGKNFEVYISDIVINEITKTSNTRKKSRLLSIIDNYHIVRLSNDKDFEVSKLAEIYLSKGIIPKVKIEDALHIAYAVVFEMDVLLSWNFKHLANIKKEREVLLTNMENGYNYPIRIVTPMEVDYEDNENF